MPGYCHPFGGLLHRRHKNHALGLGALAGGYVHQHAVDGHESALLVIHGPGIGQSPQALPVPPFQQGLEPLDHAVPFQLLQKLLAIAAFHIYLSTHVTQILQAFSWGTVSEQAGHGRIADCQFAAYRALKYTLYGVFKQPPVTLFTLAQSLFRALAGGNVGDDGKEHLALPHHDGGDAYLHVAFRAVGKSVPGGGHPALSPFHGLHGCAVAVLPGKAQGVHVHGGDGDMVAAVKREGGGVGVDNPAGCGIGQIHHRSVMAKHCFKERGLATQAFLPAFAIVDVVEEAYDLHRRTFLAIYHSLVAHPAPEAVLAP